jgi:RimJ/RimL family protein N-acetyltransferase
MMSDYVFRDLNLYKLKALVRRMKKNPAEVIARRVGFKKEGILKGEWNGYTERGDVLILAYLKSDYEKDNAPSGMITEEIKES